MENFPNNNHQSERIRFDGREEAISLVIELAQQAKHRLCILGRNIDPVLFDNSEFIECASRLARRSPRSEIRIIAQNTKANMQQGHRLIGLAQQLSSDIHIRNPEDQQQIIQHTWFLVDDFAYLICPRSTQYTGLLLITMIAWKCANYTYNLMTYGKTVNLTDLFVG
ncbi:MAG: hypothetical protein Q9N32_06395 [Gammaproteobacteria bacterium]|nr:hypothetical protein [Gammaproteobacteria bacterium]